MENDYRGPARGKKRHLLKRYAASGWTQVPTPFFAVMRRLGVQGADVVAGAAILARLINLAEINSNYEKNDGWFLCQASDAQDYFSVGVRCQVRLFRLLAKYRLIQTRLRGVPARQWVLVEINRIDELVAEAEDAELEGAAAQQLEGAAAQQLEGAAAQQLEGAAAQQPLLLREDEMNNGKERGVSTKRPAPDGNGLGLTGEEKSHTNGNGKSPEHPDVALARRFKRELEEKTILAPQWQPANQAREFSALRKSVGSENLERVFSWYCANLKNRRRFGAPTVRSPAQFRQQWGWILDCYEDANPAAAAPAIEISEDARRCASRLRDLRPWAEEQWRVLPHYIQQGFDEYGAVRERIHQRLRHYDRVVRDAKKAGDQQRWNEALRLQTSYRSLYEAMPHPHAYIQGWFAEWAELPKWNGDPAKAAWAVDHWRFLKHAKGWSSLWDRLWKEANGHQK